MRQLLAAEGAPDMGPHFPASAKRVIFLFMHGGPSQVDTFDPKPLLIRDSGKPYPGQKVAALGHAGAGMLWAIKGGEISGTGKLAGHT